MAKQRRRRHRARDKTDPAGNLSPKQTEVFPGGRFKPLEDKDLTLIVERAFAILERIGMEQTPDWLRSRFDELGAKARSDGRIIFPRLVVEKALARAARHAALPGFVENKGLQIGGGYVHIGTGGAAIEVLEADSGRFRELTLSDLYQMMRVLEVCPNIHYGVRPLIARDMASPFELDINQAYTCVKATSKPIGVSFDNAGHVAPVIELFDLALGGSGRFLTQPFCMAILVHVVSPLRFATEGVDIMRSGIEHGMPLQICTAAQAGATSPASLAGALAQGLAESLAGMMVVDALSPGHPCIYAFFPFVSDLRTGAMSGGGGEVAIANAAAAQLLRHLELPGAVSAGMTDSKIIDAQAGYEKAYTVVQAALAGADMINLSVGMLGSIMVASPEALVIDDEMCGAILRSVRGIEVRDELIDLDVMDRVVTGEGHYLGEAQTLALMKTEYVYPELGDRRSVTDWLEAGGKSILDKARNAVAEILTADSPGHLSRAADQSIRERFPIRLTP